jgi:ABC-type amino acid transport substrate-binding protein
MPIYFRWGKGKPNAGCVHVVAYGRVGDHCLVRYKDLTMVRPIASLLLSACLFNAGLATAQAPAQAPAPAAPPKAINTIERINSTNTIRIGHREAAIPFSYVDPATKKPIGYAIDLCTRVIEAAKKELKLPKLKVEYVQLSAADRLPALLDGRVDLECGSTTNTKARREQIAFTVPHFLTGAKIMAKSATNVDSLAQLEGKKVAISKGSTSEGLINEYNVNKRTPIQLLLVKDNNEAFAAVKDSKADAWMTDDILLFSFRANSDKPADWALNSRLLSVEPLAIAMRKDPAWQKLVDTAMSHIIIDGDINAIYNKWFMQPTPPKNVTLGVVMSQVLRASFLSPSADTVF